ncbi:peptidase S8 [Halobacteriales archaeon QS_8_69_26]|nr:MAG: peptidase S8 [Halobacteriales archaeon QS_8_69_26]
MAGNDSQLSRRSALKVAGGAVVAGGVTVGAMGKGGSDGRDVIVGLEADASPDVAASKADSVKRTMDFGNVGTAVAGKFSEEAIKGLQKTRDVRYVEEDGSMHALHHRDGHDGGPGGGDDGGSTSQCLPWGIDRTDSEVAHANGETGNGATIAIIDTGIDSDHPDLQGNINTSLSKAWVKCKGGSCNYPWDDDNDHGTHCAGTADAIDNSQGVVGVSHSADLVALKVLDKRGSGSFSDIAAAIEYCGDNSDRIDVGSMSLGASSGSQSVKDACTYADNQGVLLVAAAGNDGPCSDCVGYPAAYSECVAVSSTNDSDNLSSFSSTGPEVEIAAPGTDVYSTIPGGYDTFSGTSMATPHVAGAAGQLMANGASNDNARSTLKNNAENIGLASNESGAGLLDTAAALGLDSSDDGGTAGNCG